MTDIVQTTIAIEDPSTLWGINNAYLELLKAHFHDIRITSRGNELKLKGDTALIEKCVTVIHRLQKIINDKGIIRKHDLLDLIEKPDSEHETSFKPNHIGYTYLGKPILPQSRNQQLLVESILKEDLSFAIGPAGSGKTYLSIAMAVQLLKSNQVRKIILCRPAVEAGENLGFLPGDLKEKIDPFLQPLYDALQEMLSPKKLNELMQDGVIQISPLAYMRGRTLKDACVILDEAQNATHSQLKMFLTRMGPTSKYIVTGDITQIDLPRNQKSGLRDTITALENIPEIGVVNLAQVDIVRHPLVKKIVDALDNPKSNV
ncbi:PhoH family protein [Halosquirtibacter laminarini]|uniref:PhoH family protein n=1 Tax=Halosquirtibacter laminarini TaxID=3374600 RepID=A0AC61NIT0_9BACT|nr:PhoH family protein [Prolixibacteraceae bacterium]